MIAESISAFFGGFAARSFDRLDPRDPAIAKMLGVGNNAKAGVRVDGETVLGIPAILRGVNIISNAMMKVRPIIYRRLPGPKSDREWEIKHPSWKVVTRRANDLMSAGYLRKTLTAWAILRGNGLAYIERDGAQRVVGMIPMMPDKCGMAIFRSGHQLPAETDMQPGDMIRYWVKVGGTVQPLKPEDVIHIKGLSHNGMWGIDIVDAMRESLGATIAARDFSASFFGQGAMGAGIIFMPSGLEQKGQEDFAKRVKQGSEGLSKAHRFLLLEESAKYEQITIDPDKAALIPTMQAQRVDIANIIGIQGHKVGDSSRVAYNSLEQSNQEHLDDDLDPYLQCWEDELGAKCLTEEEKDTESHYVEFNRMGLVRVNLQARTARDQFERQNGIATANEIIRRNNGTPIGPVGDTYMVPANMTVLTPDGLPIIKGQAAPDPQRKEPPANDEGNEEEEADETEEGMGDVAKELAMHEISRLAKRACREAAEAARGGGGKFAEWLDRLPTWPQQPAAIAPLIESTLLYIHRELDAFTKPPHGSASLAENVARSVDAIQAGAIAQAREHLEAMA